LEIRKFGGFYVAGRKTSEGGKNLQICSYIMLYLGNGTS